MITTHTMDKLYHQRCYILTSAHRTHTHTHTHTHTVTCGHYSSVLVHCTLQMHHSLSKRTHKHTMHQCTHKHTLLLVSLPIKGIGQDPGYCLGPVSEADRLSNRWSGQAHARQPWDERLLDTLAVEMTVKGAQSRPHGTP